VINSTQSITSSPYPATSDFSVIECGAENSAAWDSFVEIASGTYCHLFGWRRVIERTYGLQTRYLVIRSAVAWLGVLPLAIMPRLPGGAVKAVSLPYCNYGGLLVAHGVDAAPIKTAAINYLTNLGIVKVELRDIAPGMFEAAEVTMILALQESAELLWKQIGDKARNQVRKGQKAGLTLRWGRDQGDDLYAIYAKNMGRLGTPVHSPRFIEETLASLGERADVLTVRLEGRAIGAMLVIKHGGTWTDPMASCLAEFNKFNPNMLMYWEALRSACDAGAKSFDFGRSHKASGTYRFKKQWGAKEVSLRYHSYAGGVLSSSDSTNFYRGQSASKLASIWQKLPSFIQMRLGPVVRRWLP
jgi:serine/alanine adding enzyme